MNGNKVMKMNDEQLWIYNFRKTPYSNVLCPIFNCLKNCFPFYVIGGTEERVPRLTRLPRIAYQS